MVCGLLSWRHTQAPVKLCRVDSAVCSTGLQSAQVQEMQCKGLVACGMEDLSPPTRGQTHAPAVGAWIPNHRIAREVLKFFAIFLIEVLEKALATHSSTLAWKIPWMEEAGELQSMGSLRVGHTERLHFHFSLSCTGEGNGNSLQCSCLENPRDGAPGGLPSMGSHRVGHD